MSSLKYWVQIEDGQIVMGPVTLVPEVPLRDGKKVKDVHESQLPEYGWYPVVENIEHVDHKKYFVSDDHHFVIHADHVEKIHKVYPFPKIFLEELKKAEAELKGKA